MHDEIEQAGLGHEPGPDVGTHAEPEPERWHVVDVFNADAVPMPLTFGTLTQALDHVRRTPARSGSWRWTTTASACRWTRACCETDRPGPPRTTRSSCARPTARASGPARRGDRSGASGRMGPWRR
jgi:hypothetical protein